MNSVLNFNRFIGQGIINNWNKDAALTDVCEKKSTKHHLRQDAI